MRSDCLVTTTTHVALDLEYIIPQYVESHMYLLSTIFDVTGFYFDYMSLKARVPDKLTSAKGRASTTPNRPRQFFPYFQYVSVVGVHSTLVGFVALYLPQSIRLLGPLPARETDRPQSEFMEALTARPTLTAGWICAGLCVLQLWWGGWVRKWYFEHSTSSSTVDEIKMDRARFNKQWFVVCTWASPAKMYRSFDTSTETTRSRRVHAVRHSRTAHHHRSVRSPAVEVNMLNSLFIGNGSERCLVVITCTRASWLSRSRS